MYPNYFTASPRHVCATRHVSKCSPIQKRQEAHARGNVPAPHPGGFDLNLSQVAARVKLPPVPIRLPTEDIETARGLAARKGIGNQTYIKMLLREALQREARRG